MGGDSGSSTTQATMMPWSKYVPPETYAAYKSLLPQLSAKYDVGLTPQEQAYYRGQGLNTINSSYTGAAQDLTGNLARSGVKGGAAAEAFSNLGRSKVQSGAQLGANIMGEDIKMKQQNTANLMKGIAIPGSPVQSGSTTTQSGGS